MSDNKNDDSQLYLTAWYVLVVLVFAWVTVFLHPNIFDAVFDGLSDFTSFPKKLTTSLSELDKEQFIATILIFSGSAFFCLIILICYSIYKKICAEDTGGLDRHTWDASTKYKKIFFQNKNRIAGKLDLKEYYRFVVEYNLCSCDKRRLEIGAVFLERKWGKPFLKKFERKPFKNKKAESNRKTIEQKRLLFLPCPECLTDIDCNNAQEGVEYSCNRCDCNYRFRKDVGLIAS